MDTSIILIWEKISPMIHNLNAEERLALIKAIAAIGTPDVERDRLAEEQSAWFARSKTDRQRYPGEFVAVKNGEILDHDMDRRALLLRVHNKAGQSPILIVHSDWTEAPTFTMHSPQLDR